MTDFIVRIRAEASYEDFLPGGKGITPTEDFA
ncbi:hypothetical protein BH09SUM1_BH09SUM1_04580 [soil metagenome]